MGGERADDEPTDTDDDPQGSASRSDADDSDRSGGSSNREGQGDGEPVDRLADGDLASGGDTAGDASTDDGDGDGEQSTESSDGDGGTAGDEPTSFEDVDGVGSSRADALRDAGFETVDDLRRASREDLAAAAGIGNALAARIEADVGDAGDGRGTAIAGADDEPDAPADDADAVGPDERDGPLFSGPESDQEMPLTEHIEEMLKRLAMVMVIAGVVSLVTFPFAERIINFLWYSVMPGVPGDVARPRVYGVLELLFTKLKVASLAGLIIALPALVYQTYQFMRPGLYPHERRYYLAAIPTSLVLALVGVSFAYFIVLPAIFTYFLAYSQDVATIGFALGRTFDLILVLMGYLALVFQIPLFIMLAMMMGLVTRRGLAERRLLFWGAFLGISFLFSPDPTGMAPVIIALTMVGLFEGTLLLTKWTGRG